jgi:hypothetical protein
MALPKLKVSNYELELPSSGEKIKYRPWLVKEQKFLMMAQESDEENQIERAFANIVSECTFGEVDPYTNPMFDLEYIFLQIRGKSVGEKITLNMTCPDDEETKVDVTIDLADINVQMKDDHTNVVQLTDKISVHMRYPTLSDIKGFDEGGQIKMIFNMLTKCVAEIHDGDIIHKRVDISNKELEEFIESMGQEDFEKMSDFFDTMPKLQHIITVKNPKTEVESEMTIEGMRSFFD